MSSSDYDVWIDHDDAWPRSGEPEPTATFVADSPENAANLAARSGEFDREFMRGGMVKLLIRRKGSRKIVSITMEPVVEYRVVRTDSITMGELRNS